MNNGHSYVVKYKDMVLKAHPLRAEEVPEIFDFMSAVKFNDENYKALLGVGCESQFRKKGALVETSESLLWDAVKHPERYTSMGIWNEDGTPESFIIAENEDFEKMISKNNLFFKEGFEDKWDELCSAKMNHTLMYKGDMRVKPKSKVGKCFFIMFYLFLKDAIDKGFRFATSEVFDIIGYCENDIWHDIDVYNEISFRAQVKGIKATYIADGPAKEKEIGKDIKIKYYSKILRYDFLASYKYIEKGIKFLNLTITEE
ncbi:MAG: hypothetical protein K1W39_15230 [Lachnospiraceae bacterium]|jgi:hypothetical protein